MIGHFEEREKKADKTALIEIRRIVPELKHLGIDMTSALSVYFTFFVLLTKKYKHKKL
jgi:hypothetical protein